MSPWINSYFWWYVDTKQELVLAKQDSGSNSPVLDSYL